MGVISKKPTVDEIKSLQEDFNLAISHIAKNKQAYYHVNSVRNFIDSVHLFIDAGIQEKVFVQLYEYVQFIRNNVILDRSESLAAFNKFIKPIAKYYETGLDFTIHIKPAILIIVLVSVAGILYLFHASILLISASVLIIYGLYLRNLRKRSKKRLMHFCGDLCHSVQVCDARDDAPGF